ncbi:ExbD/TolR family protein [Sphingosinicella sp.]|uniref:ExbD/TolR family protein n=1 Tax=Sphingosinicella sp. TaxID=1917971 RepID=UPI004037E309
MTLLPVRKSAQSRFRLAPPDTAPIATINTTPMIDMMLVLLILFIIAIPIRTHRVPLDLPQGPARPDLRPVHRLDLDAAGQARWNGVAVDAIALRRALAAFARDPARPDLHLNAHGEARYERVDEVLADIRRAGISRLGLVNNRAFSRDIG